MPDIRAPPCSFSVIQEARAAEYWRMPPNFAAKPSRLLLQRRQLRPAALIEVADLDRHGLREEDVLLGNRGRRRILAEEPPRQARRVLQANTAMAEAALVLGEELLARRIVKIDAVAVRKLELELAQRIGRPGQFANEDLRCARGNGFPVDAVRWDHPCIGRESGNNLIAV